MQKLAILYDDFNALEALLKDIKTYFNIKIIKNFKFQVFIGK